MSLVAEVDVARMYQLPEVAAILKRSERTWRLGGSVVAGRDIRGEVWRVSRCIWSRPAALAGNSFNRNSGRGFAVVDGTIPGNFVAADW